MGSILRHVSVLSSQAILWLFVAHAFVADAGQMPESPNTLVGGEFEYVARKGDSLTSIGARFGVGAVVLARDNRIDPKVRLKVNQILQVDNRHIVPVHLGDGILINVPQQSL
jgi:hypothetical protein